MNGNWAHILILKTHVIKNCVDVDMNGFNYILQIISQDMQKCKTYFIFKEHAFASMTHYKSTLFVVHGFAETRLLAKGFSGFHKAFVLICCAKALKIEMSRQCEYLKIQFIATITVNENL